jgi:hypothetical protein
LEGCSRPVLACDAVHGSVSFWFYQGPVFMLTLFDCKVFRCTIWLDTGTCLYTRILRLQCKNCRQAVVATEPWDLMRRESTST